MKNLESVFVALDLPKLSNDAIELVFADQVPLFFPFLYSDNGAAFGVYEL